MGIFRVTYACREVGANIGYRMYEYSGEGSAVPCRATPRSVTRAARVVRQSDYYVPPLYGWVSSYIGPNLEHLNYEGMHSPSLGK